MNHGGTGGSGTIAKGGRRFVIASCLTVFSESRDPMNGAVYRQAVVFVTCIAGYLVGCGNNAESHDSAGLTESPAQNPDQVSTPDESDTPIPADTHLDPEMRWVTIPLSPSNQPPGLTIDDFVDVFVVVPGRTDDKAVLVVTRAHVVQLATRTIESENHENAPIETVTVVLPQVASERMEDIQSRAVGNVFFVAYHGPDSRFFTEIEPGEINLELLQMLGL